MLWYDHALGKVFRNEKEQVPESYKYLNGSSLQVAKWNKTVWKLDFIILCMHIEVANTIL